MTSKRLLPLFIAGFLFISMPFSSGPALFITPAAAADPPADTSVSDTVCDPAVFNRMKQKAWMEAQRENYSNQQLITRPANTFALTCFDQQLGVAMNNGVAEDPDNPTDTGTYEAAISSNAGVIANANLGAVNGSGQPLLPPNQNSPSTPVVGTYNNAPTKSASITCKQMDDIWTQSQCGNLSGNNLPSLKEVDSANSGKDARNYPASCSGTNDATSSGLQYKSSLDSIYSTGAGLTNFNPMTTHFCETAPLSQLAGAKCPQADGSYCWPGKKTGFKLDSGADEITCSNPGCIPLEDGSKVMKCKPRP